MSAPRPSPHPRRVERPAPARPAGIAEATSRRRPRLPFRRAGGSRWEPPLDLNSWTGAFVAMVGVAAVLWIVQLVNAADGYDLNRFGLRPRHVDGLWGILTQPFLHATYRDMLADTLPVVLVGWVVMLAGARTWLTVSAVITIAGGALTWAAGPSGTLVIGSSSLVFGWIGYLIARAIFSRQVKWILAAAMVLTVFGALLAQLVPISHSAQSWQAHLFGFLAGAAIGAVLHPRGRARRTLRRSAVS